MGSRVPFCRCRQLETMLLFIRNHPGSVQEDDCGAAIDQILAMGPCHSNCAALIVSATATDASERLGRFIEGPGANGTRF